MTAKKEVNSLKIRLAAMKPAGIAGNNKPLAKRSLKQCVGRQRMSRP